MATTKRDDGLDDERTGGGAGDLLLGDGAEFDGKLTFAGTVRIDARFKGSIRTDDVLVVGEHARIDAEITCGTVVIHGEVNGNVHARKAVELRHTGRLRGDVETPSLAVEKGGVLQGSTRMVAAEPAEWDAPARRAPDASPGAHAGA